MPLEFHITTDTADAIYELLTGLHARRSPEESAMLNSELVLILASYVGDVERLRSLFSLALPSERPTCEINQLGPRSEASTSDGVEPFPEDPVGTHPKGPDLRVLVRRSTK